MRPRQMKHLFSNRRAQITVFMIVGIILLFSSALLFYIRGQITETMSDEGLQTIEDVPLEAQPIKTFVEQCLHDTGKKAIKLIGLNGGYVSPQNESMSGTAIRAGFTPTESDGVYLLEETNMIPYWWYLKSPNTCSGNCEFASLRPELRQDDGIFSIEGQMGRYIDKRLRDCINDFDIFKEQGWEITEIDAPKTSVSVTERDILLIMDYPLEATRAGQKTEVSRFIAKLDLNFQDIYDMASMITQKEVNTAFLETHTMNEITMASYPLSADRLPPLAEFTIDPNEFIFWAAQNVRETVQKNLLALAMQKIQVDQSRDFRRVIVFEPDETGLSYDRIGTALMDKTVIRLPENFTNIKADFEYLDWWPIYLTINDQEILSATKVSIPIISWIGLNQYIFLYNLAYPVMVTLSDPDAFAGEGYEFIFALEENLRYNQPINLSDSMQLVTDSGTLVCNNNQRQGEPANIEVKDALTGEAIDDVRLSFVFGGEGCFLGVTEKGDDGRSVVNVPLPAGFGEIRAEHKDYLEYTIPYLSSPSKEKNITIELMPYQFINTSVWLKQIHYKRDTKEYVLPRSAQLLPARNDERFMISLERQDDDEHKGYETFAQGRGLAETMLKLIPGTYSVTITLTRNDTLTVGPVDKTIDPGLFFESQTIHINQTVMEEWPSGGAVLNNVTGFFRITEEELQNSRKINFIALRFERPETFTTDLENKPALDQINSIEDFSSRYRPELEPEWKR